MVKGEFSKVSEKRSEFKGKLRELEADYGCQLIHLNTLSVKQACMVKVLRGVIEPFVVVLDGFVNRLCGELANSFRVCLEKAYFENLVDPIGPLTHISRVGDTGVSLAVR